MPCGDVITVAARPLRLRYASDDFCLAAASSTVGGGGGIMGSGIFGVSNKALMVSPGDGILTHE
jgi:hypothetical protein